MWDLAFAGLLSAVGCKEPQLFLEPLQPFLGIPEFHKWEDIVHGPAKSHLLTDWSVDWWGEHKSTIKQAQEWHLLPHRKQGLHNWAHKFFLENLELRAFFEGARLEWHERLKTAWDYDEESVSLEELESRYFITKPFLKQLVTFYNINNYHTEIHPEKGEALVFGFPEETILERLKFFESNYEKQLLILFPFQCLEYLDKEQPLPNDSLQDFYSRLQKVSEISLPDDHQDSPNKVEDAICGGIAVLVILHGDWLKQNPEKREWCLTKLVNILSNPPISQSYRSTSSLVAWHWEAFCARTLPTLWLEDSDNIVFRKYILLLALSYNYNAVKILFNTIAQYRDSFGDDFKQLQRFLLKWAVVRWKRDYSNEDKTELNIAELMQPEIDLFIQKASSCSVPCLEELVAGRAPKRLATFDAPRRESKYSPDLDLLLIQAAYSWLPQLDKAMSEVERSEWVAFWKSALSCTLRMYGEEANSDKEIRFEPFWDWDKWVTNHTIPLILELHSAENPKDFWKPILSLGRRAKFLVERFLDEWFRYGLQSEPASEAFLREWHEMVEFVLISPHWNSNLFYLEEAWCNLMGFGAPINLELWNEAQKPTIKKALDLYQLWANKHLDNPRSAIKFMIFLKQPAAEEILLDGLIWLEQGSNRANQWFWQARDIQAWCASLLEQSWRCHAAQIRHRPETFNAFRNLLKKLADFQHPLALEIQQRML